MKFLVFFGILSLSYLCASALYNNDTKYYIKSYSPLDSISPVNFNCKLTSLGNIFQINKLSTFTEKQNNDIMKAHCLWETILVGRVSSTHPGLVINFSVSSIDGVGNILGIAGWTMADYFEDDMSAKTYVMSIEGLMHLDISDIGTLSVTDGFFYVVLHEIGHILGVGSLWELNNIYIDNSGKYTGSHGIIAYNKLYNVTSTYVPVELDGGGGTANAHWDELNQLDAASRPMTEELMTGYLTSVNYLTMLTISSLKDIGFLIESNICALDNQCGNETCDRGIIDVCSGTYTTVPIELMINGSNRANGTKYSILCLMLVITILTFY